MRRILGVLAAVAVVALSFGCEVGGDAMHRASAHRWAPPPDEHTGRELKGLLPRGPRQLHGMRVEDECLDLTRPCGKGAEPGMAYVVAKGGADRYLLVVVRDDLTRHGWDKAVRVLCPTGVVTTPVEWHDDGGFATGTRGRARRAAFALRGWQGFRCTKRVDFVYPSSSDRGSRSASSAQHHTLLLTKDDDYLQVQSLSRRLTRAVATEFLDRLAG